MGLIKHAFEQAWIAARLAIIRKSSAPQFSEGNLWLVSLSNGTRGLPYESTWNGCSRTGTGN